MVAYAMTNEVNRDERNVVALRSPQAQVPLLDASFRLNADESESLCHGRRVRPLRSADQLAARTAFDVRAVKRNETHGATEAPAVGSVKLMIEIPLRPPVCVTSTP